MDLLSSPHTRLLHECSDFRLYAASGDFSEQTRFTFRCDQPAIFFCLEGSFESTTVGLTYQYRQQLVGFAFHHDCEKLVPAGTKLLVLILVFPLSSLQRVLAALGDSEVRVALDRFTDCRCTVAYCGEEIGRAATRLYTETSERRAGHELMAGLYFQEILVHVLRLFATENAATGDGFLVAQLKSYVEENLAARLTLDELARYAGYSKFHLCKLFRRATGQSFVQYINTRRVHRACERIRSGRGSINEIGLEVGFQNSNHFYKTFKKVTGRHPSAFREGPIY